MQDQNTPSAPFAQLATHRDLILESLKFTEQRIRDYQHYPSYEFKQERLAEVQAAKAAIRSLCQ